jgi:hypothetical protein
MYTTTEVMVIVGLFVGRLLVPVGLIAVLAWGLRRLDARWQAEAEAEQRLALSVEVPPRAITPLASERPCWEQRRCSEEKRERCPAYHHPALPCWLVRREAEGRLPEGCYGCGLFRATGGAAAD